ncbi:MAG: CU044_2847 family protein [Oscillatoria sp. PMC 1051.18]|nr:CU044_2847 family protein [Oscillatoria sp. PMC 1050.18]MEC5032974.1 CU044_2847 family protein [Oscillatoria sp. PMC 1051.18]
MTQLTPIQLEDGTVIYIEAQENIAVTDSVPVTDDEEELTRDDLGGAAKGWGQNRGIPNFEAVENTIKAYTNYTLNAFKKVAAGNIDKVTLKFGIKVGGKTGIPYVTEGTAESNLKITVECSFPNEEP